MPFVITNNGGCKISEKAMSPGEVERKHTAVDRAYYIERLQNAVNGLIEPVLIQRSEAANPDNTKEEHERCVRMKLDGLLWRGVKGPMQEDREVKRARIDASPIMQLFAKQKADK